MAEAYNIGGRVVAVVLALLTARRYEVTVEYYSEDGTLHRYNEVKGRYEYGAVYRCRAGFVPVVSDVDDDEPMPGDKDWRKATDPDPLVVLYRTEIVRTIVKAPVPEISPVPEAGTPVNLGLWIAVEAAGPYEAFASLGPRVWARRTATLEGIWFDPGNGDDRVWCPGRGTPLPESNIDTIEAGPCGYTYVSYGDVVAEIEVTIEAQWIVEWKLSDGRSGIDAERLRPWTSFPYDVYEIHTVGVG